MKKIILIAILGLSITLFGNPTPQQKQLYEQLHYNNSLMTSKIQYKASSFLKSGANFNQIRKFLDDIEKPRNSTTITFNRYSKNKNILKEEDIKFLIEQNLKLDNILKNMKLSDFK